jgi:PAS domain S-box-containing protein
MIMTKILDRVAESIDILMVDDELSFLGVAKELLEMHGPFEVDTASSVEEAFEKLKKKTYGAIVSDCCMPVKDGPAFLRELRQSGNDIPFIFFSGRDNSEIISRSPDLPADDYVSKNGDPEIVYTRLARCIIHVLESKENWGDAQKLFADWSTSESSDEEKSESSLGVEFMKLSSKVEGVYSSNDGAPEFSKKPQRSSSPIEAVNAGDHEKKLSPYESGAKELLQGMSNNIAERKKAENALRESQERYRNLVEAVKDWIWEVDSEGIYTYSSPKISEILGYAPKEILGRKFTDLISSDYLQKFKETFDELMRDRRPMASIEKTMVHKNGDILVFETNAVPFFDLDGTFMGYRGVDRDVTERTKAEKAIKVSQEKFEGLFRGNPEATCFLDADYKVLDINPRFKELFKYSLEEARGKEINELIVPDDKTDEMKAFTQKMKEGRLEWLDTTRRTRDGTTIPVSISTAPMVVGDELIGYTVVYKDISSLKNAEEKMKFLNEKLRVVGALTRHDVRNKLTILTGYSYTLKTRLNDNPEAQRRMKEIENSTQQIMHILEFASNYEKLGVKEPSYTNVESDLNDAFSLFSQVTGIRMINECKGLTVLADAMLREVFYNLIENSLKYGERTSMIRVRFEQDANQAKIIYEDDGVGISNEVRGNLFKEGFGRNTGYGLYLIKKICESYGWSIQETGEEGKRAQFTMTVPEIAKDSGKRLYTVD